MQADHPRQELISEIVTGYGTTTRLLKTYLHEGLSHELIGSSHIQLLYSISQWQPAPTQKILAEYMHMTPGALTQLIEPLVAAGYVIREADSQDRRIMHVVLSDLGKEKMQTLKAESTKLFTALLETLSDEELAGMLAVQQKMFQALEKHYKQRKASV